MADGHELIHRVRALVIQLDLFGAEFARSHGLHATDVRALICLLDAERSGQQATPGWLGRQLSLESASVTALIDRMTDGGLVARERDSKDRRRIIVEVTDDAKKLGATFFGPLIAHAVDAVEEFSPDQVATIETFLNKMITAAEDARDPA